MSLTYLCSMVIVVNNDKSERWPGIDIHIQEVHSRNKLVNLTEILVTVVAN